MRGCVYGSPCESRTKYQHITERAETLHKVHQPSPHPAPQTEARGWQRRGYVGILMLVGVVR